MAPKDVQKTAITMPLHWSFEFCRVLLGLRNAAQGFQQLMDQVVGDLAFCFVYLDDILVTLESREQHLGHMKQLFDGLQQFGMVLERQQVRVRHA